MQVGNSRVQILVHLAVFVGAFLDQLMVSMILGNVLVDDLFFRHLIHQLGFEFRQLFIQDRLSQCSNITVVMIFGSMRSLFGISSQKPEQNYKKLGRRHS